MEANGYRSQYSLGAVIGAVMTNTLQEIFGWISAVVLIALFAANGVRMVLQPEKWMQRPWMPGIAGSEDLRRRLSPSKVKFLGAGWLAGAIAVACMLFWK